MNGRKRVASSLCENNECMHKPCDHIHEILGFAGILSRISLLFIVDVMKFIVMDKLFFCWFPITWFQIEHLTVYCWNNCMQTGWAVKCVIVFPPLLKIDSVASHLQNDPHWDFRERLPSGANLESLLLATLQGFSHCPSSSLSLPPSFSPVLPLFLLSHLFLCYWGYDQLSWFPCFAPTLSLPLVFSHVV